MCTRVPEVVEVGGVVGVVGGGNAAVGEMEVGSSGGIVVGAEEQQEEGTMDVEEDQEQEKRKRCVIEDWNWQPTALTGLSYSTAVRKLRKLCIQQVSFTF